MHSSPSASGGWDRSLAGCRVGKSRRTWTAIRQRPAAEIGRSLDAVSGSRFVMLLDGRLLGIAMHVLAGTFRRVK